MTTVSLTVKYPGFFDAFPIEDAKTRKGEGRRKEGEVMGKNRKITRRCNVCLALHCIARNVLDNSIRKHIKTFHGKVLNHLSKYDIANLCPIISVKTK